MNKKKVWFLIAFVIVLGGVFFFGAYLPQAEERERQENNARTRAIAAEADRKKQEEADRQLAAEQKRQNDEAVALTKKIPTMLRETVADFKKRNPKREELNQYVAGLKQSWPGLTPIGLAELEKISAELKAESDAARAKAEELIVAEWKRLDVEFRKSPYGLGDDPFKAAVIDLKTSLDKEGDFNPSDLLHLEGLFGALKGKTGLEATNAIEVYERKFASHVLYDLVRSANCQLRWRAMLDRQRLAWDAATNEMQEGRPDVEFARAEQLVRTSEKFIVTLHEDKNKFSVWDFDGNTVFSDMLQMNWGSIEFSPDGSKLAVGDMNGTIKLYKTSDWSHVTLKITAGKFKKRDEAGHDTMAIGRLAWQGERYLIAPDIMDAVSVWDLEATPAKEIFAQKILFCWPKVLEIEIKDGEVQSVLVESISFGTRKRWDKGVGLSPEPTERLPYGIEQIDPTRTYALWYGLSRDEDGNNFVKWTVARHQPHQDVPKKEDVMGSFRKNGEVKFSSDGKFIVSAGEQDGLVIVYSLDGKEVFRRRYNRGRGLEYGEEDGKGCGDASLQWTKDGYVLVAVGDVFGGPVKVWKVYLPFMPDM